MSLEELVITLDGASGGGKTTLGKLLAANLGGVFLDTGSYYRMTAAVLGIACKPGTDQAELKRVASNVAKSVARDFKPYLSPGIGEEPDLVGHLGEMVVSETWIREPTSMRYLAFITPLPEVRQALTPALRRVAETQLGAAGGFLVAAGRDCGTVLWPEALTKFCVDAPLEVRSMRRRRQFENEGLDELTKRDQAAAAIEVADQAFHLDAGAYSAEELCLQALRVISGLQTEHDLQLSA